MKYIGIPYLIFFAVLAVFLPRFLSVHEETKPQATPVTLLFVGDIMLARAVETRMEALGTAYPFAKVEELLTAPDITIGNFEGIVSEPHVPTRSMEFRFSVRSEYLRAVENAGFDILSLANNHSADFGEDAVRLTKTLCDATDLRCAGTAQQPEVFIENINGRRIGFLFVHTTWNTQSVEVLRERMRSLAIESDVQVAYIHWGEEYALVHNATQEALAHALIDAGADAVIGHHPHVVQDVGVYNGKPIFYSLGNFVFDQYWNDDVQTGLGVEMTINDDSITYRAIPFFATEHAQPALMEGERVSQLFQRIMGPGASSTMIAIP